MEATRTGAVLVLVAIAIAAQLPRQAAAAPEAVAVVAVAPPPGPDAELLDLTDRLRQRIAERSPGTLDAAQLADRAAVHDAASALPPLERRYEEARALYLEGDFARSVATLRQVADALERLPEGPEVQGLWKRVVIRLARTELDLGRPEAARAALERLLRAVPDLEVDPSLVPARLADEIARARATLATQATGTLVVTSTAPGARAYVNGRDVGPTPVRLDLPRGRWRVSGRTDATRAGPVDVELAAEPRDVLLDFDVPEALRVRAGQGLAARGDDRARALPSAGAHLGVDRVVGVTIVQDGGLAYALASLYDVRQRTLEREARLRLAGGSIPPGGDAALAEFIVSGHTDSPLVQVPGAPRTAQPDLAAAPPALARAVAPVPGGASTPGVRQALRWTPVAAAAAAVAFTAIAVIQLRSAEDAYDRARRFRASDGLATPSAVATYNGWVADGDAAKGRASLYWTGAGLSAAATAVLGYVAYRRTGEFGPVRF